MKGRIYVFEGIDNVGKSTLINQVSKELKKRDLDISAYSFPGKEENTLGNLVYNIHHHSNSYFNHKINPVSLQLLHITAHIELLKNNIIPDLKKGKIVLLDRFWWSTYCYGLSSGMTNQELDDILSAELRYWNKIDITKIFLLKRKTVGKKIDPNTKRLAHEYNKLAKKNPDMVEIVNNDFDISIVVKQIVKIINFNQTSAQFDWFKGELQEKNSNVTYFNTTATFLKSPIYDEYWKFATERQKIFYARVDERTFPWTDDPVLSKYKFTNVYRATDRVSQYLIKEVIYNHSNYYKDEDIFFRIMLFKLFNKIETWETLEEKLGIVSYSSYSFDLYNNILLDQLEHKKKIYSAAYIMPSGVSSFNYPKKHQNNLKLLEYMMKDGALAKIKSCNSLQEIYELLEGYPTLGRFLAFQFTIDINYSEICNFSEMSFVVAGPGAKRGIDKCFDYKGNYSYEDIIKWVADKQENEFRKLELPFKNLCGRKLQLIDCQNIFCETDKYTRVTHPEYNYENSRIKQLFKVSNKEKINYFFPPKWEINSIKGEK